MGIRSTYIHYLITLILTIPYSVAASINRSAIRSSSGAILRALMATSVKYSVLMLAASGKKADCGLAFNRRPRHQGRAHQVQPGDNPYHDNARARTRCTIHHNSSHGRVETTHTQIAKKALREVRERENGQAPRHRSLNRSLHKRPPT